MKILVVPFLLMLSSLAFSQTQTEITTNATSSSSSSNVNTNNNNTIYTGTSTSTNNNNNNSVISTTTDSTSLNTNVNSMDYNGLIENINTSTNNNTNTNINNTISTSTINNNVTSSSSTSDSTSTSFTTTNSVSDITALNNNVNNSNSVSDSTQRVTQKIESPPPSAIAPALSSSYSQDLCVSAVSGAVSTQILGLSTGRHVRDQNCERIKLGKTLYDMGMRVAAVSLMCQDYRVWSSMMSAGTPCPYDGKIGDEARALWEANPDRIPEKDRRVK